jgi:hypothetical protein
LSSKLRELINESIFEESIEEVLDDFDKIDIAWLCQNYDFSLDFLEKNWKRIGEFYLIAYKRNLPVSLIMKIVEEFDLDFSHRRLLLINQKLPEEFIESYFMQNDEMQHPSDFYFDYIIENQCLSENFLIKYIEYVNYINIRLLHNNENISEEVVSKVETFFQLKGI